MFKNALLYRIENWVEPSLTEVEQRLAGASFVECGASQPESVGFVAPRGDKHAAFVESVGGQWILRLCTETKAVPGGVVKQLLNQRLDQAEQDTGRRPKGKRAKELKEAIVHELLPRAFPKRSETPIWVDLKAGLVMVGAASTKKADGVITRLLELLGGGLRLQPLQTALSPATAMATWLTTQEAPPGFSIDRDCELKQPDSEKAAVRYARHTLEMPEVALHIQQGKLPTQLALTWAGRVSFTLSETLALKKIKLLDVVLEGQKSDEGGFDADVALFTGEMRLLIPDLIAALGGLNQPTASPAAVALPAGDSTADIAPWEDVAPT
jgi:recombination associated protein RdgC